MSINWEDNSSLGNKNKQETLLLVKSAEALLAEEFFPDYVIIDGDQRVLYLSANVNNYLSLPRGTFSDNLLDLLSDDLNLHLAPVLDCAVQEKVEKSTRIQRIADQLLEIRIIPILLPKANAFFLVTFDSTTADIDGNCSTAEFETVIDRYETAFATMAHELRNPLAAIKSSLHIWKSDDSPSQVSQHLNMLKRQTEKMNRLIDDVLDAVRVKQGKLQLKREWISIQESLEEAVLNAREYFNAARVKIDLSVQTATDRFYADPMRLSQILVNLLTNAAKYTPSDGRVKLLAETSKDHLIIKVQDNGIGLPAEMQEKVFGAFVQGERGQHLTQGGLGLGLTLVKSLVELHEGTTSVYSEGLGKGSTFTVKLPLNYCSSEDNDDELILAGIDNDVGDERDLNIGNAVEEEESAEADECEELQAMEELAPYSKEPKSSQPKQDMCRILIIDDSETLAEILSEILQDSGYSVAVANDGIEGLAYVKDYKPDVVLCDINLLGGFSGNRVAENIRKLPLVVTPLLVGMTAHALEDLHSEEKEPFDALLAKPFELSELQEAISARK